jgi:error-prone DNA polymerase
VNHSCWDCTLENGSLRLGLRTLSGFSERFAQRIEELRPFTSVVDFSRRTALGKSVIKLLADADAFHSLELDRRQALWQSLAQETKQQPLLAGLNDDELLPSCLPAMSELEQVLADYRTQGMSLRAHPLSFYREEMNELKIAPAAELPKLRNGQFVRVAGLVLVRQRPSTAKGITFVTLEDETGVANLIIRMDIWEKYYQVARTASSLIASGRLQIHQEVIHVLVAKLENLAGCVGAMKSQSRDFH